MGADLAQIYREHRGFVHRSVQHLGVPDAAAEDVAHDVFLVAYRRFGAFEARSTVRTWLYGIARRVAKDHRRSARRRALRLELAQRADDGRRSWIRAPFELDPEESVARKRAAEQVAALLPLVDPDFRAVLVLFEVDGLTAPEIAATLRIPLNTVYSRLRSARERLALLLRRGSA